MPIRFIPELINDEATNGNYRSNWVHLWLPAEENRCDLQLFDKNGNEVKKTSIALNLGKPFQPEPYKVNPSHGFIGIDLITGHPQSIYETHPRLLGDYFEIKQSGQYRLLLKIAVVWIKDKESAAHPTVLWLPPVTANFEVQLKKPD